MIKIFFQRIPVENLNLEIYVMKKITTSWPTNSRYSVNPYEGGSLHYYNCLVTKKFIQQLFIYCWIFENCRKKSVWFEKVINPYFQNWQKALKPYKSEINTVPSRLGNKAPSSTYFAMTILMQFPFRSQNSSLKNFSKVEIKTYEQWLKRNFTYL